MTKTSDNIDIHTLKDLKYQVLYVLYSEGQKSIKEISDILINKHKISTSPQRVKNLFQAKSPIIKDRLVHHHKKGGYEIMQKGIDLLQETVICIDPQNDSSTAQSMKDIFSRMSGVVNILDPYFDDEALNRLSKWIHKDIKKVRIIVERKSLEKLDKNSLGDIELEVRFLRGIHDRCVFDDKNCFYLGTSINHIGNKLSFIFRMNNLLSFFKDKFEEIWGKAEDM